MNSHKLFMFLCGVACGIAFVSVVTLLFRGLQ